MKYQYFREYQYHAIGIPSTENGLESINQVIKKIHSQGIMLSVSQYLMNEMKMIRHWSIDRDSKYSNYVAKPFHDTPCLEDETWKRVWNYLYCQDPVIKQLKPVQANNYVMTKKKSKSQPFISISPRNDSI